LAVEGSRQVPFRTEIVHIVPYNPLWKEEFEKIRTTLYAFTGDLVLAIEHVGSTAVEGLAAKPIIDIDIVIESYVVFPKVKHRLEQAGYTHLGNLGIEGREAFDGGQDPGWMPCHLYVCPKDSKAYREHIALRNYLREHAGARKTYARLKRSLAERYSQDVDAYCENKTAFIQ
jgi:GrpB-like predicted nucleotidyltransferase (UPF0157 family)